MTLDISPTDLSVHRGRTRAMGVDRAGPLLDGKGILHHLGFVVTSISNAAEEFAASMSAHWNGEIIHDPLQRVRVAFFLPVDALNPVFELVEPADDMSPVKHFLGKRGGLHHVCYEIDDLESALQQARRARMAIASPPQPAVAFNGRRIAWVCSKNRLLIELLERDQK